MNINHDIRIYGDWHNDGTAGVSVWCETCDEELAEAEGPERREMLRPGFDDWTRTVWLTDEGDVWKIHCMDCGARLGTVNAGNTEGAIKLTVGHARHRPPGRRPRRRSLAVRDGEPFRIEDGTPVAALAVVEVITDEGKQALVLAHTDGITAWAGLGMLRAGVLAQEIDLQDAWQDYTEDDE